MKELILALTLLLTLVGCGPKEGSELEVSESVIESKTDAEKAQAKEKEETHRESIRDRAIEPKFKDLFEGKVEKDTILRIEGKVSIIFDKKMFGEIQITTHNEDEGYGMYIIKNYTGEEFDVEKGDVITFYGSYSGNDESAGLPIITATQYKQ